ncbi:transporter substrate-binding domain-containing protein [Kordiimonas gwangyangensis]|uniref:transporter substrate-binding domain-containing protein n=1 Tax=Kordiimonas gwangyangensis TaxID=288022 RepID=UPI000379602C|nr:transporter substrate-binding domain-containing protein [Kordiimonas gwangyangensis]
MYRTLALVLFLSLPSHADMLRVGTTGDYQPVSWWNTETQVFEGLDIELIKSFAAENGHEITFVRTTWPTMMADLQAGNFSIAVGGISSTPERAKVALMSDTIHLDGKVALVRCGEQEAYDSLEEIDAPTVRVVENPGGTNEKFARATLKTAKLTVLADNHEPFDHLKAGKADVMFTDALEATFKEAEGDGLCAVNADTPYTEIHKVFLFAQDEGALRDTFNTWLAGKQWD